MTVTPNAVFNDNKLKLGTFCTNGRGIAFTSSPDITQLTWENTVESARLADDMGLEAIVPFARWRGFVQEEPFHYSGNVFDTYTWAGGIAQATKHATVFVTSHVPIVHPIVAAKQCATIDHIANGRFALNVVGGWHKPELDMFRADLKQRELRYQHAEEWLEVVQRLWTSNAPFDFDGEFVKVSDAISIPKPLQSHIPIMNAGSSGPGREFAVKHADITFVGLTSEKPDDIRKLVGGYESLAQEFGRKVQIWASAYVVQRDSEAEAKEYFDLYAATQRDDAAVNGWMELVGLHSQSFGSDPAVLERMRSRFAGGAGGFPLVGTPQQIADRLVMLSDCGISGLVLTWVDYHDGLRRFRDGVLPLLEQAGVRKPFAM